MMRLLTIFSIMLVLAALGAGGYWLVAQKPAPSLAQTYGDWRADCDETTGRCVLTQRIVDKSNNFQLAQLEIEPGVDSDALRVLAPLGTWIDPGVALKSGGDGETLSMSFLKCLPNGCLADGALQPEFRAALTKQPAATMLIADKRRNVIGVPVSTAGLDEGLAAIRAYGSAKDAGPLARLKGAVASIVPSSEKKE